VRLLLLRLPKGAKQGTLKTWLVRAHDRGARILSGTEVTRVVVEAGVARGVEAVQRTADGHTYRVSVRASRTSNRSQHQIPAACCRRNVDHR
jgi:hypothetical protein